MQGEIPPPPVRVAVGTYLEHVYHKFIHNIVIIEDLEWKIDTLKNRKAQKLRLTGTYLEREIFHLPNEMQITASLVVPPSRRLVRVRMANTTTILVTCYNTYKSYISRRLS
jgi:hypothetical protein